MKKHTAKKLIVAAAVLTLILPGAAMAKGPASGSGRGGGAGQSMGIPSRNMDRTQSTHQTKNQQRLHDGAHMGNPEATGSIKRDGKAYGPGDGTGNMGVGPKDGSGYGTPEKK